MQTIHRQLFKGQPVVTDLFALAVFLSEVGQIGGVGS